MKITITQEQKDTFHEKREEFISRIDEKINELNKQFNESNDITFNWIVHDDSVSVKFDLVEACDELECDFLVLGSKGHSHSIKESVKQIIYIAYCVCCIVDIYIYI